MTHPPGQPSGPPGPGRLLDIEQHHDHIGEPHVHSIPPLPTLGMVLRDAERLIRVALTVLDRKADPASMPTGGAGHMADALFETVGYHLEAAMRDIGAIAELPLPPVGSAIRPPVAAGKEPAPGSAAVLRGAARESTGGLTAPGAGAEPDPPSGGGAPVSLPGRGVGPGFVGAA